MYQTVFGPPKCEPPPYPFSRQQLDPTRERANSVRQGKTLPPILPVGHERSFSDSAIPLLVPDHSLNELNAPPPDYTSGGIREEEFAALPGESLVVVMDASTMQGLHIVDQLLQNGYFVKGIVRDYKQVDWTCKYFTEKYGARYTTQVVIDLCDHSALKVAFKGCSAIVYTPAPSMDRPDTPRTSRLLTNRALNVLEAAEEETSLQRFVYCRPEGDGSSRRAMRRSWHKPAFDPANDPPPYEADRALEALASSKTATEQAVWQWYMRKRPHFLLSASMWSCSLRRVARELTSWLALLED